MIQFPTGPPDARLAGEELGSLSIHPRTGRSPDAPADILELSKAAIVALDLELLQSWPDQRSRDAGAAEYQLALTAVERGDHAAGIQHLEEAILMQPIHAETARQDPAFEPIRSPVQDLVGRLSVLARTQAETSIAGAQAMMQSALNSNAVPLPAGSIRPAVANAGLVPNSTMPLALPVPPTPTSPAPFETPAVSRPNVAAIELELTRVAPQSGEDIAILEHLEHTIPAYPTYPAGPSLDLAFDAVPVQELVNYRLAPPPRPDAEPRAAESAPAPVIHQSDGQPARSSPAAVADPVRTLTLTRSPDAAQPMELAQAYFDMARAHFELGTYAGYVAAAQAAALAHQTAAYSRMARFSKYSGIPDGARESGLRPLVHAARRATRRLWERLPLLAILLGWFVAGVLFGIASLPFQPASIAGIRGMLFPIWALGLVGIVLVGFVRSLRRIGTPHSKL